MPGPRQHEVLRLIAKQGRGITGTEVSKITGMTRGGSVVVLESLEQAGYIKRAGYSYASAKITESGRLALMQRQPIKKPPKPRAQRLSTKRVVSSDLKRTVWPDTVIPADELPFRPGKENPKLGARVIKGQWGGFPIYSLTLEERATCPATCSHWTDCYGNSMPFAKRYAHGPKLEGAIEAGLHQLDRMHRGGYVIRLHVLGDFYSVEYVRFWQRMLQEHPALNVFGYTAHMPSADQIGWLIFMLRVTHRRRWAVRYSGEGVRFSARTIDYVPDRPSQSAGMACPEQLGLVPSCGACGLCCTSKRPILFIDHALLGRATNG